MAAELETIPIHDKQYVTLEVAARYLGISKRWLEDLILLGKVEATKIESVTFIELETLTAFADKRKPRVTGWDRSKKWEG